MSTIRANSITNSAGTGAPDFPNGLTSAVLHLLKADGFTPTGSAGVTTSQSVSVPADATWVGFLIQGAGGGGGSGAVQGASSTKAGGGGGGGGSLRFGLQTRQSFGSSIPVVIGAGGTGAAGVATTSAGLVGNSGGDGGTTSIEFLNGSTFAAPGGSGGGAGAISAAGGAAGGSATSTVVVQDVFPNLPSQTLPSSLVSVSSSYRATQMAAGAGGGVTSALPSPGSTPALNTEFLVSGAGGGGGGGGENSSNVLTSPANGGQGYKQLVAAATAGTSNGSAPTAGQNGPAFGYGGAGGGAATTAANAGAGGNGSYGGGGGGGGSNRSGSASRFSGAGGNGGDGYVLLFWGN